MSTLPEPGILKDLKGSKSHHDLNDQPGENANEDHATDDSPSDADALPEDIEAAIRDGDGETGIAEQLKAAIDND